MFAVGVKVRCKIKGRPGGVVLWSNSKETGILVGWREDVYPNDQLETMECFAPKFVKGQLVCHIYWKSMQGYVVNCGQDSTTLMTRTAIGLERLEVMKNCFLRPVKKKKKKRKKARLDKKEDSSILSNMFETDLILPAIFVDASMGGKGGRPRISAVMIGAYGEQLYHAVEDVQCKSSREAELHAVRLGIDIRTNDSWPIYTDLKRLERTFGGCNVIWIPRTQNKIADKLLRCR